MRGPKSYGERLRDCNLRNLNPEKAEQLSPELQTALAPLLVGIEALNEQIREYNQRIYLAVVAVGKLKNLAAKA